MRRMGQEPGAGRRQRQGDRRTNESGQLRSSGGLDDDGRAGRAGVEGKRAGKPRKHAGSADPDKVAVDVRLVAARKRARRRRRLHHHDDRHDEGGGREMCKVVERQIGHFERKRRACDVAKGGYAAAFQAIGRHKNGRSAKSDQSGGNARAQPFPHKHGREHPKTYRQSQRIGQLKVTRQRRYFVEKSAVGRCDPEQRWGLRKRDMSGDPCEEARGDRDR